MDMVLVGWMWLALFMVCCAIMLGRLAAQHMREYREQHHQAKVDPVRWPAHRGSLGSAMDDVEMVLGSAMGDDQDDALATLPVTARRGRV